MEKCLTFSPKRRIEVGEALRHPYLQVSIVSQTLILLVRTGLVILSPFTSKMMC